jgi:hypothetical protein
MTGSGRSTSCVAASGRRSMKGDLFVLTVLRHRSGSLLLRAKGGDLSPNRTRQQLPHETPPISTKAGPNAPTGAFVCLWACLSSCVCWTVSFSLFDQRNKGHRHCGRERRLSGPIPSFHQFISRRKNHVAPYPLDDGFGEELFLPSSNSCRMRSFSRTAMSRIFLSFRIGSSPHR